MEPILHLSVPVRDLGQSVDFYVESLGCKVGRIEPSATDIWFFGMQVTLHERPEQVLAPDQNGVRHFGVTLSAGEMSDLLARATAHDVVFASAVATDYAGTPKEQTKAKIFDPSGNVIEIKTYVDPGAALGSH